MQRPRTIFWVTLRAPNGMLDVYAFLARAEAARFAARFDARVVEDEPYASADEAFLDRDGVELAFGQEVSAARLA